MNTAETEKSLSAMAGAVRVALGLALSATLLATLPAAARADDDACATATTDARPGPAASSGPAWSAPLLDALAVAPPSAGALQQAMAAVPADAHTDPLYARAQLLRAALLLQAGQDEAARAQLRQVATGTTAAIDAGLLMAESYARAEPGVALQWNLRVARRWPQEPASLDALAQRAGIVAGDEPAAAAGALREAQQLAVAALDELLALRARLETEDWFAQWLADGKAPVLDAGLLPVFYRTVASKEFAVARASALVTAQPALCARRQQARLAALQADIERLAAEAGRSLAELEARQATRQRQFAAGQAEFLAAARNGTADAAAGQQLNRLRNALIRDDADIAALRSTLAGLPAARARLDARAQQLHAVSTQIHREAGAAVIAALRQALDDRIARLRDIAGTAAQQLGELQDPRYRRAR